MIAPRCKPHKRTAKEQLAALDQFLATYGDGYNCGGRASGKMHTPQIMIDVLGEIASTQFISAIEHNRPVPGRWIDKGEAPVWAGLIKVLRWYLKRQISFEKAFIQSEPTAAVSDVDSSDALNTGNPDSSNCSEPLGHIGNFAAKLTVASATTANLTKGAYCNPSAVLRKFANTNDITQKDFT